MKLDRNINPDGKGKYALIKLRRQEKPFSNEAFAAAELLRSQGLVDFGDTQDSDFFVIRLKDKYASKALNAYAAAALEDDPEYANEIFHLAQLAADHPNKQRPT